jgi:hypothetical protein
VLVFVSLPLFCVLPSGGPFLIVSPLACMQCEDGPRNHGREKGTIAEDQHHRTVVQTTPRGGQSSTFHCHRQFSRELDMYDTLAASHTP